MNAETGQVYDLGADIVGDSEAGDRLSVDVFTEALAARAARHEALTAEELAAAVDAANGEPIVRVGEEAAQRARLGDRELRRRRQRRR